MKLHLLWLQYARWAHPAGSRLALVAGCALRAAPACLATDRAVNLGETIRAGPSCRLTWAAALYDWLRVTEDRVACILTGAGRVGVQPSLTAVNCPEAPQAVAPQHRRFWELSQCQSRRDAAAECMGRSRGKEGVPSVDCAAARGVPFASTSRVPRAPSLRCLGLRPVSALAGLPLPRRPASADVQLALSRHFDALIISYDLFAKYAAELAAKSFKVVVLDEAHLIKSTKVGGTGARSQD
jgi:hypothetical protein